MANTSTLPYAATDSSNTIAPKVMAPKASFALIASEPDSVQYQYKTGPLDQGERLTYRCQSVPKVSTAQSVQYPYSVREGVQYVIKIEDILRTTNSNGDIVGDEPIVAYLTVRHQKTSNITSAIIDDVVRRCIGACYEADGTPRWNDLMRSALEVTVD